MNCHQYQAASPHSRKDLLCLKLELVRLRKPESLSPDPCEQRKACFDSADFEAGPGEREEPEEPEEVLTGADLVEGDKGDGLGGHGGDDVALAEVVAERRDDEQLREE